MGARVIAVERVAAMPARLSAALPQVTRALGACRCIA